MNTIMNRNFYENARKRCMSKPPLGTHIITDADIILMQEEEIEYYRKKVASYEAADINKKLEILAIKDEHSRIADENEKLKNESKKLREEIDNLKGILAFCESELAEKKVECMELDSDNVKLQQEIDSYKETIKLRVGDFIRFGEIKYKIVKATVKPDGIVTAVAFECLEQAE